VNRLRESNQPVVLITGTSSGIGRACATYLHQCGYRVYGTSRQASALSQVDTQPPETFTVIPMDVTSDASVATGVQTILAREGRLDAVVNNAGVSLIGAVEDTLLEEARLQLETNFFGVLRVCQHVLPAMRYQQAGCIVNISSMGGLIGLPFQAIYSASKFALEGFSEALRLEVWPYGIRVVLIEPGDFRTAITSHRHIARGAQPTSVYARRFIHARAVIEANEVHGSAPERIAYQLERILRYSSPRLRYPIGSVAERIGLRLKQVIPSAWFEWVVRWYYRLL
jgi:NAD(P)-dependent dehydrogenase (short-subunit alcohol dehydrogenase family)